MSGSTEIGLQNYPTESKKCPWVPLFDDADLMSVRSDEWADWINLTLGGLQDAFQCELCKSRSGEFLTCHIAVVILRGLYKILQKSSFHGCWLAIAVAWRSLVVRSCLQWGRSNLVDPLGMSDPIVTWVSVWGEPGRTAPTRNT